MKITYIKVVKKDARPKELFREGAKFAKIYPTSFGPLSFREIIYEGLRGFENESIPLPLYILSMELLLYREISLPHDTVRNPSREIRYAIESLKELDIIRSEKIEDKSFPFFNETLEIIRILGFTTSNLAKNFRKFKENLIELEKELFVDPRWIEENYPSLHYSELRDGKKLPSDYDIDVLEKEIFGRKIIKRKQILYNDLHLRQISERILESWYKNEKIKEFIRRENIEIPEYIEVRILAPRDFLLYSFPRVHFLILSLIYPKDINTIVEELKPYSKNTIMRILALLESYGIITSFKKGDIKYYNLNYLDAFMIARLQALKLINKMEEYIKALEMYRSGENISSIAMKSNLPPNVIYRLVNQLQIPKKYKIPQNIANILERAGILSESKRKRFEEYGLIS